jgi:hypothetical protein
MSERTDGEVSSSGDPSANVGQWVEAEKIWSVSVEIPSTKFQIPNKFQLPNTQ